MGDVLPLRASPRRSIVMVSYQKGKRSLMAGVSILKMIRFPFWYEKTPSLSNDRRESADILVGNDWWWFLFSFIPYTCTWICFDFLLVQHNPVTYTICTLSLMSFHVVILYSVLYWHRNLSPFRLIGAKAKFMIEVIPVIVAAALPHLLESDTGHFLLLISCTTYFSVFAHFMHAAYDIGGKDVFLGLAMVLLVHRLNQEELLVGALALSFCLVLSFYRYLKYCAPELPVHPKKAMELPC